MQIETDGKPDKMGRHKRTNSMQTYRKSGKKTVGLPVETGENLALVIPQIPS